VNALVGCLLAVFAGRLVHSAWQKAPTFDEPLHIAGGASYWKHNDYRLHPGNGALAQRIIALPLAWQDLPLLPLEDEAWRSSRVVAIGAALLSADRASSHRILLSARGAVIGCAVLLAWVLYLMAGRLLGTGPALAALLFFTLSPNVLAYARLATSGLIGALFLLLAVQWLGRVVEKVTLPAVMALGLAAGGAVLSKASGLLLAPVALIVALRRVFGSAGLDVGGRFRRRLVTTRTRFWGLLIALVVSGAVAYTSIWACYGFRYQAIHFPDPQGSHLVIPWSYLLGPGSESAVIDAAREHHLLPEAFVYGLAFTRKFAQARVAFLNGEFRVTGWWYFFPLAFLMKTPLPTLVLMGLAVGLAVARRRAVAASMTSGPPFAILVFCAVYGLATLSANLNIGLRHLLPLYPFLFMALGWAAKQLYVKGRVAKATLAVLVVWMAADSFGIHPHYLAYFNPAVGGPSQGYRHLIDSSLDWGQDLETLETWLEEHPHSGTTRFAYFGSVRPRFYGIDAERLPSYLDPWRPRSVSPLTPGRYLVSASLLPPVYLTHARGPWTPEYETTYQELRRGFRSRFGTGSVDLDRLAPGEQRAVAAYEEYRFRRLTAFLWKRKPDAMVGYTILVYELSQADLDTALDGPPPFASGLQAP
jgi:hypothetical protein